MASVLAVCGLAVEARIAARAGMRTVAGGGHAPQLADAIEREITAGAVAILSFGIAGSLSSSLFPGATLVASEVVNGESRYPTHVAWSNRDAATAVGGSARGDRRQR